MTPIILIQARMGSTRLPGKVVRHIMGIKMLSGMLDRLSGSALPICVITPPGISNRPIWNLCEEAGVSCLAPNCPEDDLVSRHILAAVEHDADTIIRIPSDNPLVWEPAVSDLWRAYQHSPTIYGSNIYDYQLEGEFITGFGAEIAPIHSYRWVRDIIPYPDPRREHPHKFFVDAGYYDHANPTVNLGVDTPEDFNRLWNIVFEVGWDADPSIILHAYRKYMARV